MSVGFGGFAQIPGIDTILETTEAELTWGQRGQAVVLGGLIDSACTDAGNSTTTILRPGLLLGRIESTKKWTPWSATGTNGSENIAGVLMFDQAMLNAAGTAKDRWFGYVLAGGNLKASKIIVPGGASAGINGDANELLIRALLTQTGRFRLDDELWGNPGFGYRAVKIKTADYTILESDNGTLFTTEGAAGAVIFTLPVMRAGFRCTIAVCAAQNVTLTSNPADTLIGLNDIAADTIALSTGSEQIGGVFDIIGLASGKALVVPHLWEAQTATLAS